MEIKNSNKMEINLEEFNALIESNDVAKELLDELISCKEATSRTEDVFFSQLQDIANPHFGVDPETDDKGYGSDVICVIMEAMDAGMEEDDYDLDDEETPYERRLSDCQDMPERAAEIWGAYEDDYSDALTIINGLESELEDTYRMIGEMLYECSWEIDGYVAYKVGLSREEYSDRMEESDANEDEIVDGLIDYDCAADKGAK